MSIHIHTGVTAIMSAAHRSADGNMHGLRMLNPVLFTKLPLKTADSTNCGRNIGIDKNWRGTYQPASKETRAAILVERIEQHNSLGSLPEWAGRDLV